MGETTDKIETFIESKRDELGSNLQELEQKVKSATDWRQQFQKNPMTLMGVALGGGILLAAMLPSRRSGRGYRVSSNRAPDPITGSDRPKHKALETWDNVKGALIGVAAKRFTDLVDGYVPGFHEQFERTVEKSNGAGSGHRM